MTMKYKPLFGDLIADHEGLAEEIKVVDVAADLTLLLHYAGKSRADLARALGWSRARVTQVLSGNENLTVQTIAAVTKALGYTFDAVFRKTGAPGATQPWDAQATLVLGMVDASDLKEWMSRKTMKPMAGGFAGAMEIMRFDPHLDSSNQDAMYLGGVCAA
jgi:transcriptional regulator with XRE-family HTH domain